MTIKHKHALAKLSGTLFAIGAAIASPLAAQDAGYVFKGWDVPLPPDTAVLSGKLPNGLTYFIKHNPDPKGKASFYFAQRVGSAQENDDQRGLAHFLEHMAFNGTKHFSGHELVGFLERHGIGFGEGINAFTSVDHTIYHIDDLDVTRPSVLDSALLILHDWSGSISLKDKEIDKERGVIESEWRGGETAQSRIFKETVRQAFPQGHPYGTRLPIGEIDVIRSFPYDALRDYYHTWYRPDLQAVVVSGDVDPKALEEKIKAVFSGIPLDKDLPERVYREVPDHPGKPYSFVVTDPEAVETSVTIHFTRDAETAEHRATPASLRDSYLINMVIAMMNGRYTDLAYASEEPAPYFWAYLNHGPYLTALTEESLSLTVLTPEGKAIEGMTAAISALQSALRYGFDESEYLKIKENFESYSGSGSAVRSHSSSAEANAMANHFATLSGRFTDPGAERSVMSKVRREVSIADIDSMLRGLTSDGRNLTICLNAPTPSDSAGYTLPDGKELLEAFRTAMTADSVEPYHYVEVPSSLMKEAPKGGTLVRKEEGGPFGSTKLILGNGVEVYLLQNDKDPGHVTLSGISEGGLYLYDYAKEGAEIKAFNTFAGMGGIGEFSPMELYKVTMNSRASASTQVTPLAEAVSGSSSAPDFEQMMQIIYLKFTQNRKDSAAFEQSRRSMIAEIEEREKEKGYSAIMSSELPKIFYPDSLVRQVLPLSKEDLKDVDYGRILEMYDERFANAADFKFFIVGGYDEEKIIPLITRYLGALPSNGTAPERTDYSKVVPYRDKGVLRRFVYRSLTPISHLYDMWVAPLKYDFKTDLTMQILNSVLDGLFVQTIREDESGTYGIAVLGQAVRSPGESSLYVNYQADPASAERLNQRVKEEIHRLAEGHIDLKLFENAVKGMQDNYFSMQSQSGYWLTMLVNAVARNDDRHTDYLYVLDSITPEDVSRLVNELTEGPRSRYFEMRADGLPEAKQLTAIND